MEIHQRLETTLRNLRHAARALARAPGFTATVVATLALGIGANSAVFSAIYAVLLRPLPFPDSDQLVTVAPIQSQNSATVLSPRCALRNWNRMNTTFQAITGYYAQDESELSGELPEQVNTRAFVAPRLSASVGDCAGYRPRFRHPPKSTSGGPQAVLISDRLWRHRFGAAPDVIGKSLRLGGSSVPIVGVMPASFPVSSARGRSLVAQSGRRAPSPRSRELTWF